MRCEKMGSTPFFNPNKFSLRNCVDAKMNVRFSKERMRSRFFAFITSQIFPIGWTFFPSAGHFTHRLDIFPIGWTFYPSAGHFTHRLDILPIGWTFFPSAGHFSHRLDIFPIAWTFFPSAGHFSLRLDIFPIVWTFYPSAGHFTHRLDILPIGWTFFWLCAKINGKHGPWAWFFSSPRKRSVLEK